MRRRFGGLIVLAGMMMAFSGLRYARSGEIGWIESFALSADRAAALKQLIPGTEDFYYYHCLHYQNLEQWEKVEETLAAWVKRYQWTPRAIEIQNRQALLTYPQNPQRALQLIRDRLNLQFNHQRELLNQKPNLATKFNQDQIAKELLTQQAFNQHPGTVQGFEDRALEWLAQQKLTPDQRRHLISRLQRPDVPNLVKLIIDDLNYQNSGGFGQFPIHSQLLLAQLEECLKLKPELRNHGPFVNAYLLRLQPSNDANWRQNPEKLRAYLDRLWTFAKSLDPVHNSVKAHVLYHQLVLDRQQGKYDPQRFLEYLKLPKNVPYIEPKYMEPAERRDSAANLLADYTPLTALPIVGNDEPLVRDYLMHFFVDAKDYQAYAPYVRDDYLKQLFAETKIVNGLGDPETWYSLLPPEQYQQLKNRIDLDFAPANQTEYSADAAVGLDLYVKNVETLLVKVFEINTQNYYRQNGREIGTEINLDGLVANEEQTYTYKEPSLLRVKRRFDFPTLNKRGVYVIDFIGNGKASRALIRKGKLRYLVRTGVAGQVFTVFDENNKPTPQATIWNVGTLYTPDKAGQITLPFSNQPARQALVISNDGFSSLEYFNQEAEQYRLATGFYVDREELLARRHAQLLIRPRLFLNGTSVTNKVLEEPRLTIISTDLDGVATTKEVRDLKLLEDRELVHDLQVPQRMANIRFIFTAKTQVQSRNEKTTLSAEQTFAINEIDRTEKTEDLHFARINGEYVLDLLGKSGESKADRAIHFVFKLRDFTQPVNVSLQTDARGRIKLGALGGVAAVTATGPQGMSHAWTIRADEHTYSQTVNAAAGETITLPYMGTAEKPQREELSLLELRGDLPSVDRFDNIAIEKGLLHISKLEPGDYSLFIKPSGTAVRIRITAGQKEGNYVLGDYRKLEVRNAAPLQMETPVVSDKSVRVQLRNANKFTRVHIFATRFQPIFSAFGNLRYGADEPYFYTFPLVESQYIAGRDIGDEYRYIIERKYARKFPGNMLERPSLLLNPWAIRSTETAQQVAAEGAEFGARGMGRSGAGGRAGGESRMPGGAAQADFANLDFLAAGSLVLVNAEPDKNGVVEIPRADLGPHQDILIVAIDPENTVSRSVTLPEAAAEYLDLRLAKSLDPKQHFTQQQRISFAPEGKPFAINDITSTKFEIYDSLPRLFMLYATLSNNGQLAEFDFIKGWKALKDEEKKQFYLKYASHELHFFIHEKDPDFFKNVLKPYLANKKEKQFLDNWLLEEDAAAYAKPWKFQQLNAFERILLGRRIKDEATQTTRLIKEQFELLPPDPVRFNQLFQTALKGSSLETGDALGIDAARDKAEQLNAIRAGDTLERFSLAEQKAPADAAPPAPAAAAAASPPPMDTKDAEKSRSLSLRRESGKKEAEELRKRGDMEFKKDGKEALVAEMDFLADDTAKLKQMTQYYRKLDKTMEWVESNYYKLPLEQQQPGLIAVNSFWNSYAQAGDGPFFSTNPAEATHNFPEMLMALALIDLPFTAKEHKTEFDGVKMTLTPGGPAVIYHQEIQPATKVAERAPILVSENYFRHGERFRSLNGEQLDKFITEEFLVDVVYGCHVVVTNPTSAKKKLDVLLQIPTGAMAVVNGQATKSIHLDLEPYHTQTLEYFFYFPSSGKFPHYPVQVADNGEVLAFAAPFAFNVVKELTNIDKESWDYISQHGTNDDVLNFLKTQNVLRVNLDRIAWRMKEKPFFETVLNLLATRHIYNNTLWSYGVQHDNPAAIRQFLLFADDFVRQCGEVLNSPLLVIDPIERRTYEQMDYRPLVNARVGQLGRQREILNDRFFQQYQRLLKLLTYRRQMDDSELMTVTYYLLLQDRVADALDYFGKVNAEKLPTRLQYDYFAAYLHLSKSEPQPAKAIAAKYADYPVERWKLAFANVANQVSEIQSPEAHLVDKEDRTQIQTTQAANAPAFDFVVESKQVKLNYQNLTEVKVNYYLMDVELLFSRNPFVQGESRQFSFIQPNLSETVKLPAKGNVLEFGLPPSLHTRNVLVEIVGSGETKSRAYYANSLAVRMLENSGQVQVLGAKNSPLPQVYVKVYAKMKDGNVRFFKDGYTDLRGRFDYTSLNTNELDFVDKFALLIFSDEQGSVVREAAPPKR